MTLPDDRPRDHAGMAVLSYEECLRLAGSEPVGRIAFADNGEIHIFPVNHCVVGGLVGFRTADGTKLGAALDGSVVAFEVDRYDSGRRTGWSVLIKGRAELVTEGSLLTRLRTSGLRPWCNRVPRPAWIAIRPDTVTGRQL
jgi:nitroimidazol reductase NimA-like FMN-containing flavoprotein (pyridoxamine 5'-phosphate oxidase superfamily)